VLDRRLGELVGAAKLGDADTVLALGGELSRAGRTGPAVHALTRVVAEGPPSAREAARRLRREALQVAREGRGALELRHVQSFPEAITALAFPLDGQGLAVGTAAGTVARLDPRGELVASAQAMTQGVSSLHFSLCGSALGAGQGMARPMVLDPRSLHPRSSFTRARGWVTAVLPGPTGTVVVAAGEWFRHWFFPPDSRSRRRPLPDLHGLLPPWAASRPEDLTEHSARVREQVDRASMLLDGTAEGPRSPARLHLNDEMILADPLGEWIVAFHRGRLLVLDLATDDPGPELRLTPDLPRHGWEDQGAPAAALAPGGDALCLGSPCYAPDTNAWSRVHRYRPGATCLLMGEAGPRVLHLLEDENVSAVAASPDGDGFALGTEDGAVYRLSASTRVGEPVDLGVPRAAPPRPTPDLRETPSTRVPTPGEFARQVRLYLDQEIPTRVALDDRFLWVEHLRFDDDWAPGSYLLFDLARLDEGPAALVSSPPGQDPRVLEDRLGVGAELSPPPSVPTWAMGARASLNQALLADLGAPTGSGRWARPTSTPRTWPWSTSSSQSRPRASPSGGP
jgi:hypothetical protein